MANLRVPIYERQVEVPQGQSASGRVAQPVRQAYGEDVQQAVGNFGKALESVGRDILNIEKNKMLVIESKLNNIASNDLRVMKTSSSLDEYNARQKESLEYMKQTAKDYLGSSFDAWNNKVGQTIFEQTNLNYEVNKIPFIKEQEISSFADLTNEYSSNWSNLSAEDRLGKAVAFETSVDLSNLDPIEKRKVKQRFEVSCFENEIVNASPIDYNNISSAINSSDLDEEKKYTLQRRLLNQISTPQSQSDPNFIKNIETKIDKGDIEDSEIQSYYTKGDISRTERDRLIRQNNSLYNQAMKAGIAEIKAGIISNPLVAGFEKQEFKRQTAIETFKIELEARKEDIRQGKITPMAIAQRVLANVNDNYILDKQNSLPIPEIAQQVGKTRDNMIAYTSQELAQSMLDLEKRANEMSISDFNSNLATLKRWYDMALLRESMQQKSNIKVNGNGTTK